MSESKTHIEVHLGTANGEEVTSYRAFAVPRVGETIHFPDGDDLRRFEVLEVHHYLHINRSRRTPFLSGVAVVVKELEALDDR